MPSLTARDCYSKPDLGKIWERIREQGLQPFQEVDLLDADPPRKFNIVNPELGLRAPGNIPFLVLEAYEDMFTALFKTRDKYPAEAGDTCLFYIGHPGIGVAPFFPLCVTAVCLIYPLLDLGKTMFMLYAFVRCCVEGRPLALTWSSRLLYYLPDGRYVTTCGLFVHSSSHSRRWRTGTPDRHGRCRAGYHSAS